MFPPLDWPTALRDTVHLLVVDAYQGARPMPAFSHKIELNLAEQLDNGSSLSRPGERSLRDVVAEALRIAEDKGVEDLIAFATSAVREAKNGEDVLARIRDQTGAQINVMTGHEEARLTFLAARRWFGWSSGRLLVIDIGGTTVKMMISRREKRKFDSGPRLSPKQLVAQIKKVTEDWSYSVIAIGFPAPVKNGRITRDPKHLGQGWVGWDFKKSKAAFRSRAARSSGTLFMSCRPCSGVAATLPR